MYNLDDGTHVYIEDSLVYLDCNHIEVPDINITQNDIENLQYLLNKVESTKGIVGSLNYEQ